MFAKDQYQLLDFGGGRRLERFANWILDRPCPAAENHSMADPPAWRRAHARFIRTENDKGNWDIQVQREFPQRWPVAHGHISLELKCSPFGHVGMFPEQARNWDWIARQVSSSGRTLRVLNLFAYTGGSTLAAAAAGAEVTHVDAARNTVAWARRNAELSGLVDAPIRWIADDAVKFVRREIKRHNYYDAVILDPPSYGHGARGEVWRLAKHLPDLLSMCGELTEDSRAFMLLTCHTPGYGYNELKSMVEGAFQEKQAFQEGKAPAEPVSFEKRDRDLRSQSPFSGGPLTITATTGKKLPCGMSLRWEAKE